MSRWYFNGDRHDVYAGRRNECGSGNGGGNGANDDNGDCDGDDGNDDNLVLLNHGVYPAALWREVYACLPAGREEELDFIINYDIKYRMGKELSEGFLSEEGEG